MNPWKNRFAAKAATAAGLLAALFALGGCAPTSAPPPGLSDTVSPGSTDFWGKANPTAEERRKGGGVPGSD